MCGGAQVANHEDDCDALDEADGVVVKFDALLDLRHVLLDTLDLEDAEAAEGELDLDRGASEEGDHIPGEEIEDILRGSMGW